MSVRGVPSQPGVSLDVMDCATPLCKRESQSVVQYAIVTPASAMCLPISRPLSYSDRLSSLPTLAMQPVWPPGQVAVLSPLLLKSAPLGRILSCVNTYTM